MLAVKHNAGDRVMFGMAKSDESRRDPPLCGKLLRRPGKDEERVRDNLLSRRAFPLRPPRPPLVRLDLIALTFSGAPTIVGPNEPAKYRRLATFSEKHT